MWSWFGSSETDRRLAELRKQLVIIDAQLAETKKQLQVVVADLAESLVRLRHLDRPKRVALVKVNPVGEFVMDQLLSYEILLPVLVAPHDVVSRQVTVTVDGAAQDPSVLSPEASVVVVDGASYNAFQAFDVKQGATVSIEAKDIDDGGNPSAPVIYSFQATDTIPPVAPSGLTVRAVGEKFAPDETDTPEETDTPDEPEAPVEG